MENRYPLFAGRRILRKESLWDIRDYSYLGWQLYYDDYTDGLLKGCSIRAEDGVLIIGRGMIKFHGFIYLLQEEERIFYQPENAWRVLKAEFSENENSLDYKAYRIRFFLDGELACGEHQMEMCRFYLREGSVLRDSYKGFSDMATEYDTINLIHAAVAGVGKRTLHPVILLQFAEELWQQRNKEAVDINFCFLLWNMQGRIERSVITAYLGEKEMDAMTGKTVLNGNQEIYESLGRIIDHRGLKRDRTIQKRIIVE